MEIKNQRQNPVWEFTKTIIPFALVGYEVIITNSRYALIGYFITSYPMWAHGIIILLISIVNVACISVVYMYASASKRWSEIDQFRYIKIQLEIKDLVTGLWGINPTSYFFNPTSYIIVYAHEWRLKGIHLPAGRYSPAALSHNYIEAY